MSVDSETSAVETAEELGVDSWMAGADAADFYAAECTTDCCLPGSVLEMYGSVLVAGVADDSP